jgi:ectoine hydroxylase
VYSDEAAKSGPLTVAQLSDFERDGFLYFDNFYDADAIAALQAEAERLRVSEEIRQSELAVTEPTSGETRSVFAVQTVSDLFSKLARDERLMGIVHQILSSDVYLHQACVNMKPGFRGKEFYWHSDFETWHAEDGMPSMRAVSCSIALTDNFAYNGPVMVMPGSHKHFCQCTGWTPESHYQTSLKKQDYGVPSDEQLEWLTEQGGIASPTGKAGSLMLLDCNILHGSNGNISPYPRRNAFFVYNSVENQLEEPFAADERRPWFLGNREPEILTPVDFQQEIANVSMQPA